MHRDKLYYLYLYLVVERIFMNLNFFFKEGFIDETSVISLIAKIDSKPFN